MLEKEAERVKSKQQKEVNSMTNGLFLQDAFLSALSTEKTMVSVYLTNGIKLQGQITAFDQYVLLLRNTMTQMVYKHAVSTIVPARDVRVSNRRDHDEDDDEEF